MIISTHRRQWFERRPDAVSFSQILLPKLMDMQAEAAKVERFLTLMSPLVPDGKLAVIVTGAPQRSNQREFRKMVVREAARLRAHRARGICELQIHFGPGKAVYEGGSLLLCVDIDDETRRIRSYRMTLLFLGCLVLFVLLRGCARTSVILK